MKVDNITLMMFVLNFVEFCFILELIYSSDFHEGRQYFMLMCSILLSKEIISLCHYYTLLLHLQWLTWMTLLPRIVVVEGFLIRRYLPNGGKESTLEKRQASAQEKSKIFCCERCSPILCWR